MSWIKLVLHPDDPKVAIVAQEIGASKAEAYVAMLRWLFWLDANYGDTAPTVSSAMFKAATGWPNDKLAAAFRCADVDWLVAEGDRLAPTRPDSHFSASAKRRALDATRQAKLRMRGGQDRDDTVTPVTPKRDATVTRIEEKREEEREESNTFAPTRRKPPVDADSGGWWGKEGGIQFHAERRIWRGVTDGDKAAWASAYPAVDVVVELARSGEWCVANGARGRKSNYRKFLNGWLSRCQDKGGSNGTANGFGKHSPQQRRAARAADEFPEQIILPTS